jgi:hypothetical protein
MELVSTTNQDIDSRPMDRPEYFSEGGTTQHNTTQHDSQEGHCSVELDGVSQFH